MFKSFFVLLIFSKAVLAQEDVDFSTVERLNEIRKSKQEKVLKTQVERIQRNSKPKKYTKLDDIIKSDVVPVVIIKGTELIRYESNQKYHLKNNLTTQVYKQQDDFGFFYLKQKNDLIKFKVHRTKLHFLNHITKMYEEPDIFIPEKFTKKLEFYDENLYTAHLVGWDWEFISSKFTGEVLGEEKSITGTITGYSYTYMTDWSFPIDFGLTARFENTSFEPGFYDNITNRTFLVGATFKSKGIWYGSSQYKILGRVTRSLLSRLTTRYLGGIDRYDLNTYSLELGIERHWENFLGSFIVGLSYKKRWVQLEESTSGNFINDLNTNDSGFGFYLTQRFGKER